MAVEQCDSTGEGIRILNRFIALDSDRKPVEPVVGERTLPTEQTEWIVVRDDDMVLPPDVANLPFSEGIDLLISGDEYTVPHALEPGRKLPDVQLVLTASSENGKLSFKVSFDKREVSARETIETPAGIFEAFRITERMTFKFLIVKASMKMVTWYAPDTGIVRKEMQKKNGKVVSCSELISVSLPAPF